MFIHNIEPATTTALAALLFTICPPAAVVAEAIAFGAVGIGAYYVYKKTQKDKEQLKFFSDPSHFTEQENGGCFSPDNNPAPQIISCFPPADITKDKDIDCTIEAENPTKKDIPTYEKPEAAIIGCAFPKAEAVSSILCFGDT